MVIKRNCYKSVHILLNPPDCRSEPDRWMSVSPQWNLTVEDVLVTEFSDPASYLVTVPPHT